MRHTKDILDERETNGGDGAEEEKSKTKLSGHRQTRLTKERIQVSQ